MYIYSLLASFYWLFITQLDDEAYGYLKRVIVTPAVYPRLVEFLHFDIQSTGQKSHCVNTAFQPSQCYVLIRQSDSPCPYQFQVGCSLGGLCCTSCRCVHMYTPICIYTVHTTNPIIPPSPPQPLEPILFPKLRIHFADFPYLHCSIN